MSKTVAIIDDESEMEYIYSVMLDDFIKKGLIEMEFFTEASEFFSWFESHAPDLILSDINMPQISGPDIIKRIKQSGRRIPTYLVSGYDPSRYQQLIQDLGVRRYITKPLNFPEICSCIEADLCLPSVNL